MPFLNRRKFLQITAGVATTGALGLGADTIIFGPNHPKLVPVEIPLPRLPASLDGITIAQLSDFHYDETFSVVPVRKSIEIVNNLRPDLVVLTGDFVTAPFWTDYVDHAEKAAKEAASVAEPCASLLGQLQANLGVFAVLGNHDVVSDVPRITSALQGHGIAVLRNQSVVCEKGGGRIWLAGLDSVMSGKPDVHATLGGIPHKEPIVLLVHEPDVADVPGLQRIDLQLSGHSHGGQIWLPGIGAPWLPPFAKKYPRGLNRIGALTLYTNIGLGTIRLPVRVNCPPEITLFTLRSTETKKT